MIRQQSDQLIETLETYLYCEWLDGKKSETFNRNLNTRDNDQNNACKIVDFVVDNQKSFFFLDQ